MRILLMILAVLAVAAIRPGAPDRASGPLQIANGGTVSCQPGTRPCAPGCCPV